MKNSKQFPLRQKLWTGRWLQFIDSLLVKTTIHSCTTWYASNIFTLACEPSLLRYLIESYCCFEQYPPHFPTSHLSSIMTGPVIRNVFSELAVSRHLRQARLQLEQERALDDAIQRERRRAMKRNERAKRNRDQSKSSQKWQSTHFSLSTVAL